MALENQGAMGRRYSLLGTQRYQSNLNPNDYGVPMMSQVAPQSSGIDLGTASRGLGAMQSARSGDQQGAALQGASMIPGTVGLVAQGIGLAKSLTPQSPKPQITPTGDKDRMQRRLESIQSDPSIALEQGINAAQSLPRDVQQQVLPQLVSAQMVNRYGRRS